MIIYEVNLNITPKIFREFLTWLNIHIQQMLEFPGFISSTLYEVNESDSIEKKVCIQYLVASQVDLDNYFTHHAKEMRQAGIDKFGQAFTATRRILAKHSDY